MLFKKLTVAAILAVITTAAQGARVQFYTTRGGCAGAPSEDYQGVACNTCIDPPGDWFAVQVSEIGNTRWTAHNQDKCTSKSQVGQWYGNGCANAGATALRSVWVAC